jgi:hypothetical protein
MSDHTGGLSLMPTHPRAIAREIAQALLTVNERDYGEIQRIIEAKVIKYGLVGRAMEEVMAETPAAFQELEIVMGHEEKEE